MKRTLLLALLCLTCLLSRAQTVTATNTAAIDLSTAYATDSLTITLKRETAGDFTGFKVLGNKPTQVKFNSTARPVLNDAVSILPTKTPNQWLVKVNMKLLQWAGNYDVEVSYYWGKDSSKVNTFNISMNRPPAVAESTSKLTAGLQGFSPYGNDILIRESSGRAGIPHLKPSKLAFDKISGTELVKFLQPDYDLPAGGNVTLKYKVNQDSVDALPVGVYPGKVYFTSPSLGTGTLAMDIEISNKRSKLWIIGIVLAGLAAGFGVRIVLKGQADSEQARLNALLLQKQITEDSRAIHDADLQADVQKILSDLQLAFQPQPGQPVPDATAQAAAVTNARNAYTTKRAAFDLRYLTAAANYDQIAHPVFDANLPLPLADLLVQVRAKLQVMKDCLNRQDVKSANVAYADAGTAFAAAATRYQLYAGTLFTFVNAQAFLPAQASANTKANLAGEATKLQTLTAQIVPSSTTFGATLATMLQLQQVADGLDTLVYNGLLGDFQAINANAVANAAFQAALQTLSDALQSMADNPSGFNNAGIYYSTAALTGLNAAWTAALGAAPSVRANFTPGAVQHSAVVNQMQLISGTLGGSSRPVNFLLQVHGKTLSLNAAIARSTQRFVVLNLVRTLLLTLLISLLAYKMFGDNWVGKWGDMIGLFLAAFSVDITTDTISTLKSKLQ